jgi:phosphopantothenoylcysteine decarboxylase/phosphopantothenate--cysteine ligase
MALPLEGKTILVTAGPTYEAIDPVRFVGNRSSGKMGYAIAQKAKEWGATVHLISGPTSLKRPKGVRFYQIESADEMLVYADQLFNKCDIAILSAAVADFKPKIAAPQKIKKKENVFSLELEKTVDIALELGNRKQNQILVGFALETNNEEENARKKLQKKNFDFIVLNSLNNNNPVFGSDQNKISILNHTKIEHFELNTKEVISEHILSFLIHEHL